MFMNIQPIMRRLITLRVGWELGTRRRTVEKATDGSKKTDLRHVQENIFIFFGPQPVKKKTWPILLAKRVIKA